MKNIFGKGLLSIALVAFFAMTTLSVSAQRSRTQPADSEKTTNGRQANDNLNTSDAATKTNSQVKSINGRNSGAQRVNGARSNNGVRSVNGKKPINDASRNNSRTKPSNGRRANDRARNDASSGRNRAKTGRTASTRTRNGRTQKVDNVSFDFKGVPSKTVYLVPNDNPKEVITMKKTANGYVPQDISQEDLQDVLSREGDFKIIDGTRRKPQQVNRNTPAMKKVTGKQLNDMMNKG